MINPFIFSNFLLQQSDKKKRNILSYIRILFKYENFFFIYKKMELI